MERTAQATRDTSNNAQLEPVGLHPDSERGASVDATRRGTMASAPVVQQYTRQQLLRMGWTATSLRHLGPPLVRCVRGRYEYEEHSWPRDAVLKALRTKEVKAWLVRRKRALAAKRDAFMTPAQFDRQGVVHRARLARDVARSERKRARDDARKARQLAIVAKLGHETLLKLAPACMHAENRRAKHTPLDARTIYALKNRYLVALLRGDTGTVLLSFEHTRDERTGVIECGCGNAWYGYRTSMCYECGDVAEPHTRPAVATWYIAQIGEYRFHQPERFLPVDLRGRAQFTDAHDPTQPPREIPEVRVRRAALVPAALQQVIARATAILEQRCVRPEPTEVTTQGDNAIRGQTKCVRPRSTSVT